MSDGMGEHENSAVRAETNHGVAAICHYVQKVCLQNFFPCWRLHPDNIRVYGAADIQWNGASSALWAVAYGRWGNRLFVPRFIHIHREGLSRRITSLNWKDAFFSDVVIESNTILSTMSPSELHSCRVRISHSQKRDRTKIAYLRARDFPSTENVQIHVSLFGHVLVEERKLKKKKKYHSIIWQWTWTMKQTKKNQELSARRHRYRSVIWK